MNFADHPGGIEARKPGQIDGGLGVSSALQYAALLGPQREDVAGPAQVGRTGVGVDRHLDGAGAIVGGNSRADAVLRTRIHAHREGGLVAVGVAIHHQGQIQGVEPLALHGQADQAPGLGGHEVDLLGRCKLRGADQIAFIFPIFIVYHHD